MMKLYLDNIIYSILNTGGISVVWTEMIKNILKDKNIELHCLEFNNSKNNIFRQTLNLNKHQTTHNDYLCLKLQRYLNPNINCTSKFIFHSSYYRTCPNPNALNITTVHDFTYEYFSSGLKKEVHVFQKHNAIRKSDLIICISENTKRDLLKFIPEIDKNKIHVVYNGVSDEYHIIDPKIQVSLPYIKHSYALFVGARSGYKNFTFTMKLLSETKLKLVIVGNELSMAEIKLLNHYLPNRYKCVGKVSNKRLNELYNNAFTLVYPSLYEGFGIPIIEAQRAGCPTIALDNSSILEVMGNRSTLLSSSPTIEEGKNIIDKLYNKNFREECILSGLANTKRFSWTNMSEQVIKLYDQLYNQK